MTWARPSSNGPRSAAFAVDCWPAHGAGYSTSRREPEKICATIREAAGSPAWISARRCSSAPAGSGVRCLWRSPTQNISPSRKPRSILWCRRSPRARSRTPSRRSAKCGACAAPAGASCCSNMAAARMRESRAGKMLTPMPMRAVSGATGTVSRSITCAAPGFYPPPRSAAFGGSFTASKSSKRDSRIRAVTAGTTRLCTRGPQPAFPAASVALLRPFTRSSATSTIISSCPPTMRLRPNSTRISRVSMP
jgi:hypothetical protein